MTVRILRARRPGGRHRTARPPGSLLGRIATVLGLVLGVGSVGVGVDLLRQPPSVAVADAGELPGADGSAGDPAADGPLGGDPGADGSPSDDPAAAPSARAAPGAGNGVVDQQAARAAVSARARSESRAQAQRRARRAALLSVPQPPALVRVPAVNMSAPVIPVGVEPDGDLQLPEDPDTLGWWAAGGLPGPRAGTVVLAGHIDALDRGAGVMKQLVDVPLGTAVQVVDGAGASTGYRITARRSFPKQRLPADLFTRRGPGLVLVTCGGTFDERTGHYSDNVVLYGVPT